MSCTRAARHDRARCRHFRRRRPRAITLIEMTTSLVILSVLLVTTGSAIVLASRAMPDRQSGAIRLLSTSAAFEQLATDLTYATAVSELGATAIEFTVPDRTGDGAPDVLRYAWDARPGSPLTRRVNGGAAAAVLEDAHEFAVVYTRRRETLPATYTESAEAMLFSQEAETNLVDLEVTSTNWVGQTIRPVFDAGAAWWRVTRVRIQARKRSSDDGETRVQVRGADLLGNPTTVVHDQAALLESSLISNYRWRELRFTRDSRLTPGEPACVVLQWARNGESCEVPLRTLYTPGGAVQTFTGGTTWAPAAAQSMLIQVYGVTARPDPPRYRYALNDVRVTLRAGSDEGARVTGSVVTPNAPEVPAP